MIDTDKYEGHTPAPWHEIFMQGDEYNNGYDDLQTLGFNGEAQDLIADAPLILEAYKELREWKAEVERICRTMSGPNRDTALFIMTNEVEEE